MLCLALVFLVFWHMFFSPAWFCIKPGSMVLHVFFYSAKEHSNVFFSRTILCFAAAQQILNLNLPGIEHATDHWHRFKH
jgi:hypothetical protein